jgi:hypothetical protein
MSRLELKTGERFGKLIVLGEGITVRRPSGQTNRTIKCKCDCGTEKDILLLHLIRNRTKSCGCINKTKKGKSNTVYGILLNSMRTRCKENYFERHLYFDKDIKVCDEWLNDIDTFISFCKKNGYEKGLQIDRIDNSKGYSPDNCRFVTPKQNVNNRDNTVYVYYKNEKISLRILLERLNLLHNFAPIYARIKRGVEHNKAIDTPIRIGNYSKTNFKNTVKLQ